MMPMLGVRISMARTVMLSVIASAASVQISTKLMQMRPSSSLRRSTRSTSVPVIGPRSRVGPRSQRASTPSIIGEALSRHISQPRAMEWIQVPMTSGTCARK